MLLSIPSTNASPIDNLNTHTENNTAINNICKRVDDLIADRRKLKLASTSIALLNVIATPFVAFSLIPISIVITAGVISVIAIIILARSESKKIVKIEPLIKDILKYWVDSTTEKRPQIETQLRKLKKACNTSFNLDTAEQGVLLDIDPSWESFITEERIELQKTKNEKTACKELLDNEKDRLLEQIKQDGCNIEELYKPTPLSKIEYKQSGIINSKNNNAYTIALLQAMHNCASLRYIFRQKIIDGKESINYLISEKEITKENKAGILMHISNIGKIDDITDKLLLNLKIMLSKKEGDLTKPNNMFSKLKKILVLNTLTAIVAKNKPISHYDADININLQRSLNEIIGKLNAREKVSSNDLNILEKTVSSYNRKDSDKLFETLNDIFNIGSRLGYVYEKIIKDEQDNTTSTHLEPFLCYTLEICSEENITLENALIAYHKPQKNDESIDKIIYKLNCVPSLLPIAINRSHSKKIDDTLVMINTAIKIPLNFTAPKNLFSKEQDDIQYALNSVICRYIEDGKDDHYITYRRTPDNKWLCCDNSKISEIDNIPEDHLKQNSHMLFYERIDNQ